MFKDVATFTVIDEEPFFASFEQAIPRFDEIGCVGLEYRKYPDVSDLAGTYVFEAFFEDAGSADGATDIWAFAWLTWWASSTPWRAFPIGAGVFVSVEAVAAISGASPLTEGWAFKLALTLAFAYAVATTLPASTTLDHLPS